MRIVAIEGLSGVGKSTLAPLVAERLDAQLLPTIPRDLGVYRKQADDGDDPTFRHLFYVWAIATACQRAAAAPTDSLWVAESYIGRAMAFHIGMGSTLWVSPWTLVPKPVLSVMVTCDDPIRRERIRQRGVPPHWHQRAEDSTEPIRGAYRPFADVEVPNDENSPEVTADRIVQLVTAKLEEGQYR
ncbi:hypothetical protein [Amycolatopsis samaneae]|uniref:Uncharacterized protein n=1 Tax=Amycolatopsis samaneae TaxID=664691 RepID=A0ABW5GI92_9PSEU